MAKILNSDFMNSSIYSLFAWGTNYNFSLNEVESTYTNESGFIKYFGSVNGDTDQEKTSVDLNQLPLEFTIIATSSWPGIIAYLVVFIVASVGNLLEFFAVWRRLRIRRSPMNILLMNLCIADILVVLFVAFVEIVWRINIGWYGGRILCKLTQFCRAFSLYLSSLVLICLTVDRYYAVLHPLKVVDASKRVKILLIVAWMFSAVCAAPQCVIFDVHHHPKYHLFTQCTSVGETAESVNTILSICFMYFLPFFFIIFCNGNIIYRLAKENDSSSKDHPSLRRSDKSLMDRAKIRALKLTFVIVIVFIVCWTPYIVITMWHIVDRDSAEKLNPFIQEALFIMVVANSCANPLVYGVFNARKKKPDVGGCGTNFTTTAALSPRHSRRSMRIPPCQNPQRPTTQILCMDTELGRQVVTSSAGNQVNRSSQVYV